MKIDMYRIVSIITFAIISIIAISITVNYTLKKEEELLLKKYLAITNNIQDKDYKNKYIFIDVYKKDKNIIIKVKDNAGGIPDDIIDRVFEPYFTTKHKSKGTGIGLYMSEEIISKHLQGEILVSNCISVIDEKEYIGAEFVISIPI
ncbi:HAMP domain-containing histidine kinase [Poseidonibacter lekithochrous]|uniref:ATP-binding protein n=1 Tax=Poseidonibacter TaxID=2321187 RepID=UPI001C0933D7|nr:MULTISPECIES: HAMP domain-containing sensor histidine kinase [Poseidonibacter]MBU3013300.1 HAMP domain-containing histidine kinase [Poseidonibacter lekithochrous]MDO6826597.1 HAMP domain-containing sensor histidine kinase [Poseidonibacter sp. 1_MG-2023]